MNSIVLSGGIFLLMTAGIYLGSLLRKTLPQHHLSKESQDVIRLGVGLIATMAALVVGLLIASAKSSFDTQSGQVRQITADIILLDMLLSQYGPEAQPIREKIRVVIPQFADRIWREKAVAAKTPFETNVNAEAIYLSIQTLPAKTDLERSSQSRAAQITTDIAQTRLLLFAETDNSFPLPFLGVLTLWLVIIFASFSLFFGPQHDCVRSAVAVRAVGLVCDIPDPGAWPAVHRDSGDLKRTVTQCTCAALSPRYFRCSRSQRSEPGCSGTSIGVESVSVTIWMALPLVPFSNGTSSSRAASAAQMS